MDLEKNILKATMGVIVTRISDGMVIHVNKALADYFGYTPDEMIGKTAFELNTWAIPDQRSQMINELMESGTVSNFLAKVRKKDGSQKDFLLSSEMIAINDEKYSVGIVQDI